LDILIFLIKNGGESKVAERLNFYALLDDLTCFYQTLSLWDLLPKICSLFKGLARFDDIQREYRVSLDTSKKQEALYRGSSLYCIYQDVFKDLLVMAKFEWDRKEIEPAEWLARTLQRNKAEAALKKARNKERVNEFYNQELEKLLTVEEKQASELRSSNNQTQIKEINGRYQIDQVLQA
jgi:adenylate kinase family enzyme